MKKKTLIALALVLLVVIIIIFLANNQAKAKSETEVDETSTVQTEEAENIEVASSDETMLMDESSIAEIPEVASGDNDLDLNTDGQSIPEVPAEYEYVSEDDVLDENELPLD